MCKERKLNGKRVGKGGKLGKLWRKGEKGGECKREKKKGAPVYVSKNRKMGKNVSGK